MAVYTDLLGHDRNLCEDGLVVGPHEHDEKDVEQCYQDDPFGRRLDSHWKEMFAIIFGLAGKGALGVLTEA